MWRVGAIKMAASHSHILYLTISVSLSQNYFNAQEKDVVTNGPQRHSVIYVYTAGVHVELLRTTPSVLLTRYL
jgi:hypothetical protein